MDLITRTSSNEIKIFDNPEFGQIRIIQLNDEPYFCMVDICRALEIKNISDAKSRLKDDGVVSSEVIDSLGRKQQANFINEPNMYKLIFQSRKQEAEKFTDWVTNEILPSIRKHGAYMTDETLEKALTSPDFLIQLATKLKEEREARIRAEQRNAVLMHVNRTYTMTEIAKELGLRSATELNKMLADLHIQYKVNKTWVMYSDYSHLGYEDIKQEVLDNGTVVYHRKITQAGREFIVNLINDSRVVNRV